MVSNRFVLAGAILAACPGRGPLEHPADPDRRQLPTGVALDPEGRVTDVGPFPLAALAAPEGDALVLLLNGFRTQGIQVVTAGSGQVRQTVEQPAAFIGMSFDWAGRRLYASGGNEDRIYVYDWRDGSARLVDSIALATKAPKAPGTRYPAGIGVSPDGTRLYVAENLADSLAVVDVASGRVTQRLPAGRYPYAVAVGPDGTVFVSAWGAAEVRAFRPDGAQLAPRGIVAVPRHPSALLLDQRGDRLYVASASTDRVAVVDTTSLRVTGELADPVPGGTGEGSTPNALALSPDDTRLYVAGADNNAVAVFDLASGTLLGRIPVGWYPTALVVRHDTLLVLNGKGRGSRPNGLDGPRPGASRSPGYTLEQLSGTLSVIPLAGLTPERFAARSTRAARANHWSPDT
ncbi:MAG: YncE family protein, partial [Gemmatimonadota bacterium]